MYTITVFETKTDEIIWSVEVDDIELAAGILAAGVGIMEDINYAANESINYIDSDVDVSSYRLLKDVEKMDMVTGKLEEKHLAIWMQGSKRAHFNLFTFSSPSFLQGIISICTTFQVDFRNYVYGLPYDKKGNYYKLLGYSFPQYQIAEDAPDFDDYEEDESRDENIIVPLPRTDDIYTFFDT